MTPPTRSPRFYLCLLGSLVIAAVLGLIGVSPISLLFLASVAGGLGTPVTLVMMMLLGRDRRVMHDKLLPKALVVAGWTVTALVSLAGLAFVVQTVGGGAS